MQSKARWIALGFGLVLLALIGWRFSQVLGEGQGGPARGGGRRASSQKVAVSRAAVSTVTRELEVVGSVESSQNVDIVARTAGVVVEVNVRQGDEVKKGQVLARIDDAEAKASLYKVQSDLATAKFNYFELLSQQNLTEVQTQSSVEIAAADLSAARANLDKAKSVHTATQAQGQTSVVQALATLSQAKAQLRQTEVDFEQAKVRYDRMLGLQRQGFASGADAQDAYAEVLSKAAAVDAQKAATVAAQKAVDNAQQQANKDNVSAKADIANSQFTTVSAKATLEEAQAGVSKTATFQQQLKARESLVEAAQAELQGAQLKLQQTVLTSPVDGFVSDRKLDSGAVASVGSVLLTVQAGGEVWIVSALPQEIYRYVEKGEECEVTVDGLRNRKFKAHVFAKDAAVDTVSRQFNIRVKIDDQESLVKPGMFARVHLTLGPPGPRLVVPSSALYEKNDETRTAVVYVVENGKVRKAPVDFGLANDKVTIIRQGLEEGAQVVVSTAATLRDGQEVQIGEETKPTASMSPVAPGSLTPSPLSAVTPTPPSAGNGR